MPAKNHTQTNRPRQALVLLATGIAAVMCGCTTSSISSVPVPPMGGQGGPRTGMLFDRPEVERFNSYLGGAEYLPEFARRDAALNVAGAPEPLLATTQWPQSQQPSLDQFRTVFIPVQTSFGSQPVTFSSSRFGWSPGSYFRGNAWPGGWRDGVWTGRGR